MNRLSYTAMLLTSGILAACSSGNTPDSSNMLSDPTTVEPMGPTASGIENGQQFTTSSGPAVLAALLASEAAALLNEFNQAITSGTTASSASFNNCLSGFDGSTGNAASGFSCGADIGLSATTASAFSAQMILTDYCEAALANQTAENCALQDGSISLPLEWVADATGTPSPLLAATITYVNSSETLSISTPEQVGMPTSTCTYDVTNGELAEVDAKEECFKRLNAVVDRIDSNKVGLIISVRE